MSEKENPGSADVKAGVAAAASGRQVRSAIERQKDRAAGELDSIAEACRRAASSFPEGGSSRSEYYIAKAAQVAERLSNRLREKDARDLLDEAAAVARRHPFAVAAGGLLAGALLGRFLGVGRRGSSAA